MGFTFQPKRPKLFLHPNVELLFQLRPEKEPGLDPVFKYEPRFKLGVKQLPFVTRKIGAGVLQPSKRCRCRRRRRLRRRRRRRCRCRCASAMKRGFEHTWRWASR